MADYIAFLRAINVGGRKVTMKRLREVFESLGFSDVETFIASGNVVFSAPAGEKRTLERKIETALSKALGFEVDTFVRTRAELAAIATHQAFPETEIGKAPAFNVGFLAAPLSGGGIERLEAFSSEIDRFHADGHETYWLCRRKQSESTFSNAVFERALKVRATFRSVTTIRKLAAEYPPRRPKK